MNTCRKCHKNSVPRRGMVCTTCRRHTGHASASRPVSGSAGAVLARLSDARIVCQGDTRPRVVTTWDVIRRAEDMYHFRAMDMRDEQFGVIFSKAAQVASRLNAWKGL